MLTDLFELTGVQPETTTVIFSAVDGYTTSLPLETVIDKQLIMAYQANGIDLPPEMGYPFIIVAEDKLGYKWARWVDEITLSDDTDYKGFWNESGIPTTRRWAGPHANKIITKFMVSKGECVCLR